MQHLYSDHYEIYYDSRSVTVYSTERLKLESKEEHQYKFKRDVRNAINQLHAKNGESINAI